MPASSSRGGRAVKETDRIPGPHGACILVGGRQVINETKKSTVLHVRWQQRMWRNTKWEREIETAWNRRRG